MQKIDPSDFVFKKPSKKSYIIDNVVEPIHKLDVGEAVLLKKSEWNIKSTPNSYLRKFFLPGSISIRSLESNDGWVITKVYSHPECGSRRPDNYESLIRGWQKAVTIAVT